jgi:hypothetical protein
MTSFGQLNLAGVAGRHNTFEFAEHNKGHKAIAFKLCPDKTKAQDTVRGHFRPASGRGPRS